MPASAEAVTLESISTTPYTEPTYVASDPTNPDRLFVTEKSGTIAVTTPSGTSRFLDISEKVLDDGERGLWSIAFPPDFATSRLFYVAYSDEVTGALTLDEYREQATPPETKATRREVFAIPNEFSTHNHNGGQLQFGPDGYLYWSTGDDNEPRTEVPHNSQDMSNFLGKLLRLDPRSVPASPQIWAIGLRNPWRFSFDRLTGDLAITDVGANAFEEVNILRAAAGNGLGANFGWPACEAFEGTGCSDPAFTAPIYAYSHGFHPSTGEAIAGGYVVRDPDLGDLYGRYLFADTYAGDLRSIDSTGPTPVDGHREEGLSAGFITSFGEDACGRIYVVAADDARVYRLEGPSGGACPAAVADTDPPETSLRLKRKNVRGTKYVARLTSDEPSSTFECKLDKRRWKPCAAKRKLKRLDPGRHRFRARAIDAAGNADPTPAKKRFRTKRR